MATDAALSAARRTPGRTTKHFVVAGIVWASLILSAFATVVMVRAAEGSRGAIAFVMTAATLAAVALLATGDRTSPGAVLAAVLMWFFAIAPALQLASGRFSIYHIADPTTSFILAATLTLAYGASFAVGLSIKGRSVRKRATAVRPGRVRKLVLLGLGVGALGWVAYFNALGGWLQYLGVMQNRTQLSSGLGYLYWVAFLFQVSAAIAAVSAFGGGGAFSRRAGVVLVLVAASLILFLGMRSRAVMYVGTVVIAAYLSGARFSLFQLAPLIALGLLVIFIAGRVRVLGSGSGAIFDRDQVAEAVFAKSEDIMELAIVDYGHFDRLSMIWEYFPQRVDFQYGSTLGAVMALPIPRSWYPAKPVGAGPLLANAFRPGAWDLGAGWASGQTPTILGEFYMNFSWPGVVLGGLAMGFVAGRAYRRWRRGGTTYLDALQYAVFLVYVVGAGTLGEVYGTVIMYSVFALPVAAAAWYCRKPSLRGSGSLGSPLQASRLSTE